ncbi:hypothetical protein EDB81DRAFT_872668 [Dactylonectria macrodidyma]|uniref:Transcription factor domain-containing protein n=1 Tax=Dactylonectria macrodidyma TaxID=307937 RepID=A0A9P9DPU6_9HYPO|nr:hypothetical protein EDB81DRAFT_872668 [Dactylonectria macrodidyma]
MAGIYQTKIYFQPLPLLNPKDLRSRVPRFPQFLRWSFLTLCLHYSENYFYNERESQAIGFYTTSSQETVMNLAAEGVATKEVTQALCLLALGDIMVNKQSRAWMSIGAATKLESLRMLSRRSSSRASNDDTGSRCYWSSFTLEKAFSPTITVLDRFDNVPPLPPSPPLPALVPGQGDEGDLADTDGTEPGIIAPSLKIISIWGDIIAYLSAIRLGKTEIPWSSNSTYSQLMIKLQEFEIELGPPHRFENILAKHRLPSELHSYREYWTPWTIMQLSSHAALAVLNHPFIHLVALRDRDRKSQPKLFLQQVIDQALFHTGWLEVNDPLMGHQVAATAIIPWLFQFAQDQHIARNARKGLHLCEKSSANSYPAAENGTESSTVTFNTASFWKILDSPPHYSMSGDSSTAAASSTSNNDPNATLRVTNKFAQPWPDEQSRQNVSQVDPPFFSSAEGSDCGGQVSLGDFFSQFAINDVLWTQPSIGPCSLV